jgi:hypothetical protein
MVRTEKGPIRASRERTKMNEEEKGEDSEDKE